VSKGRNSDGVFGRVSRAIRSALKKDESYQATLPSEPSATTGLLPTALSANDLVNEGLQERKLNGPRSALPLFERATQIEPNSHLPLLMLGNVNSELGDFDQAAAYYERARDIEPKNHIVRYNLGLCQLSRGYIDSAIAELAGACYLNPTYEAAHSAFIMALHYSDRATPEEIAAAIREWGAQLTALSAPKAGVWPSIKDSASSRLRVGFVSGDFRTHSVAHFFEPIASARCRSTFEYVFYSNSEGQDEVTGRLRAYADSWRDIVHLSDSALIELICADDIDILVDLSGHTSSNRLAVFAARAAPVQIAYLGFPDSTGLPTMDFRIADGTTDPPIPADSWHTETLLRLPESQWCFRPFGAPTPPGPLPALDAGFVTFGSFNNLTKISDTTLRCWTQILLKLPTARLRLTRVHSPKRASEIVGAFEKSGIRSDRIDCVPYRIEVPYGAQFVGVDIALDPYPYNGVTTSCECLFVGVPVISLYGRNSVSRSGLCILSTLGLRELAASTEAQYIDVAVALASDLASLVRLRQGLRGRVEQSSLRNEELFAKRFEELLQLAWQQYLERRG
jgi:protein O-GlcNAc transferase